MTDIASYKTRLEAERDELRQSLKEIAERVPESGDWVPKDTPLDIMTADQNEFADRIEERFENQSELDLLERRYSDVMRALEKIENGTFGTCEISGEPIEEDRLAANPAARTCKAHMNEEGALPL